MILKRENVTIWKHCSLNWPFLYYLYPAASLMVNFHTGFILRGSHWSSELSDLSGAEVIQRFGGELARGGEGPVIDK